MFSALKNIHLISILLSGGLFITRGILMYRNSPRLGAKPLKILPGIADTLLIGSALGMTVVMGVYPFQDPWLTTKLLGAIAYVGFAHTAIPRRSTALFVLGLAALVYVLAVAVCRDPLACFGG